MRHATVHRLRQKTTLPPDRSTSAPRWPAAVLAGPPRNDIPSPPSTSRRTTSSKPAPGSCSRRTAARSRPAGTRPPGSPRPSPAPDPLLLRLPSHTASIFPPPRLGQLGQLRRVELRLVRVARFPARPRPPGPAILRLRPDEIISAPRLRHDLALARRAAGRDDPPRHPPRSHRPGSPRTMPRAGTHASSTHPARPSSRPACP